MTIEQIQYFLKVVECNSFSEAAEELYTTQSSVSKHIRSLEQDLNVQLFDRSSRRIRLTEAGNIILSDAQKMYETYEHMSKSIIDYRNDENDTITIASIPVMAQYDITGLIANFESLNSNVHLAIQELEGIEILSMLEKQEIDFAFFRLEHLDKSYDRIPLFQDQLAAIIPACHPLSNCESISLKNLSLENFLLLNKGTLLFDQICDACHLAGFDPRITYTGTRIENILELVGKQRGISLMMRHAASYLSNPHIKVVPISENITSTVGLVKVKRKSLSPIAKAFWNFAKSYGK